MAKKKPLKKVKRKAKTYDVPGFEEIEFTCANCGKTVKMIKTSDLSTEGMLCQKCGMGERVSDSG